MPSKTQRIAAFCEIYQLPDPQQIEQLYEIDELLCFLPPEPTAAEKTALQKLIGAGFDEFYGYIDHQKSTNTFELIMQWREKTGNL